METLGPYPKRYPILGGLAGVAFGLLSGIALPAIFIASSLDSRFEARTFVIVGGAIALIYLPASAGIGTWIGWVIGEKARADAGFRFSTVLSTLVREFFQQWSYRVLAILSFLFMVGGGSYVAYLHWSGKAACLESAQVDGRLQCVRTSWLMSK